MLAHKKSPFLLGFCDDPYCAFKDESPECGLVNFSSVDTISQSKQILIRGLTLSGHLSNGNGTGNWRLSLHQRGKEYGRQFTPKWAAFRLRFCSLSYSENFGWCSTSNKIMPFIVCSQLCFQFNFWKWPGIGVRGVGFRAQSLWSLIIEQITNPSPIWATTGLWLIVACFQPFDTLPSGFRRNLPIYEELFPSSPNFWCMCATEFLSRFHFNCDCENWLCQPYILEGEFFRVLYSRVIWQGTREGLKCQFQFSL